MGDSPRGHRDHGLVQQPEALLDPLLLDQGAALLMYGEGEQVCIAETLADLGGVGLAYARPSHRRPHAAT